MHVYRSRRSHNQVVTLLLHLLYDSIIKLDTSLYNKKGKSSEYIEKMPPRRRHDEGPPPISSMLSSAHDLDVPLTAHDMILVEDFEAKWSEYMQKHPELMPSGGRSKRVTELRGEVLKARMSQKAVEKELEDQIKLFGRSRDSLEFNYQKAMQETNQRQKKVLDVLQKELGKAVEADTLESQLVLWEHFLSCVDKTALVPAMALKEKTVKPSARAVALVDQSGDPSDVQLRAYRIDHALLTAQVEMLQKEIIRCEKTTDGLDLVGKFLTENNIWALLSKSH